MFFSAAVPLNKNFGGVSIVIFLTGIKKSNRLRVGRGVKEKEECLYVSVKRGNQGYFSVRE